MREIIYKLRQERQNKFRIEQKMKRDKCRHTWWKRKGQGLYCCANCGQIKSVVVGGEEEEAMEKKILAYEQKLCHHEFKLEKETAKTRMLKCGRCGKNRREKKDA